MSDLDEKLKAIAHDHGVQGEGQDMLVDEVKQVFAEAGYIDLAHDPRPWMTGKRWFGDFMQAYADECDIPNDASFQTEAIKAARRAAGLDKEDV